MIKYILFISILIIFSSCRVIKPNEMFKTEKAFNYSQFEPQDKEYTIKPFDKLDIRISTNDGFKLIEFSTSVTTNTKSLGLEYLVEYDGLVKVPTLGRIKLEGYTLREAEKVLEEKYSDYYQNPFVQIRITNRKVFLFKNGGQQAFVINIPDENITLIEALAQSGGLTDIDKSYKIKLLRGDLTAEPKVYNYNIYKLESIKDANLLLQANDIIYVESKVRIANRILTEINPYLSLLSTILLIIGLSTL